MASAASGLCDTSKSNPIDRQLDHDATKDDTIEGSVTQTPTVSKEQGVSQALANLDHKTGIPIETPCPSYPADHPERQSVAKGADPSATAVTSTNQSLLSATEDNDLVQPRISTSTTNDPAQSVPSTFNVDHSTLKGHDFDPPANEDPESYQYSSLQVDSQDCDTDSALGESMMSSTASMRSSFRESVEEHGRTYHKYKQGKYYLPNDEMEQDRLDLQHHIFLLSLDGKLHLAPLDNPKSVLDIGTGTGIWALEFATQNPNSKVIATDLSPIQPAFVPPNCQFEIDDAEDDWMYTQKFDFIHGRTLCTCFKDPRTIFRKAYEALAPGGYFEMQDVWIKPHSHDGTVDGTNLSRWNEVITTATEKLGRDWQCPPKYAGWFREVGFENVVEQRLAWPQNTWPKGQKNKTLGAWTLENTLEGAVSMSTALLTRVLGWSREEVDQIMAGVTKDMKNRAIHAYYPVYIVYGRKPL